METCDNCTHCGLLPEPGTGVMSFYCTRNPPQVIGIGTSQGVLLMTQYPKIGKGWPSCGEYELPEEEDDTPESH